MTRQLRDSVVVITGASSGIGHATARAFAGEGAMVILAARRKQLLEEVEDACIRRGGRASGDSVGIEGNLNGTVRYREPERIARLRVRPAVPRYKRVTCFRVGLFSRLARASDCAAFPKTIDPWREPASRHILPGEV